MKRGDVVLVAPPGDFGKPRPAVVIQTDLINDTHASVLLCLITSHLADTPLLRLTVSPTPGNGLIKTSQIQADKLYTARREKIGPVVGAWTKPPWATSAAPWPLSWDLADFPERKGCDLPGQCRESSQPS